MYQLNQVPSEKQIRKFLRRIVFGKNVFCPQCRGRQVTARQERYRCASCRIRFSLLSHTWLKGMKLPFQNFWAILWCWTQAIPVKQAMALTHLSEEAVRRWYGTFRLHLPENNEQLSRVVQLDEAYGKGWVLLMAKQKHTRKLAWACFPGNSTQRHHALRFLQANVKPRTKLATDGALIYKGIEKWWPVSHVTDIHKRWEFGKTSEIEGMFGNLRTFLRRMYHHVHAENMPEYVSEFAARFSSPELFENPKNYLAKSLVLVPFD
jgi:transposase-like protein